MSERLATGVAILLKAQAAVYVEVPKVACSSIKIALAGLSGIDLTTVAGDPHKVRFPTATPSQTGSALYPGFYSFAFVRNPWDRLVSCYRDKILGQASDFTLFDPTRGIAQCLTRFDIFQAGMPFDQFVDAVAGIPDDEADDHFRSQHTFVTNTLGDIGVDLVGRFERLASDFQRVCQTLGLPSLPLPLTQAVRPHKNYMQYYTLRTRGIVASRFREDVRLFAYEFGR